MSDTTSQILDDAGNAIHRGTEKARATASRMLDEHGREIDHAKDQARDLAAELTHTIRDRPLTSAMVAIGLGIVIGRITA